MFVCIQIDPTKSFTATFVHLWLSETHSYVLGRDTRSGHICHYSYVLGWGTKIPSSRRNLAIFCEDVCLHLNRPNKVIWGNFCTLRALWDSFVRIEPRYKKWTYLPLFVRTGLRYLKAKNKPKYSNILHVLEVSTYFLHQICPFLLSRPNTHEWVWKSP